MESKPAAPQAEGSAEESIAPGDNRIQTQALLSALTELSARAGHDMVGPLNQAASLLALFIRRYRNQIDSEADQLLDFLQSASVRMEGVVSGMRQYMEIAGHPMSLERVDLNLSVASALALLEERIAKSGAVVVSDLLPTVWGDAGHMAAIFEILIDNSIKFRRPDAAPRVQISMRRAGEIQVVAVADNGIGLDREYTEAIFLPFKRLNGREYPGAGLGLAVAKLITELHGGHIGVDFVPEPEPSAPGSGGTCVQFTVRPV